jgi:hypothetical protein
MQAKTGQLKQELVKAYDALAEEKKKLPGVENEFQ